MSGINKAGMPQWGDGTHLVSIEGIDAIMLRGHKHDVMRLSRNGHIGHKERLRINIAIDGVQHVFAKLSDIDVARRENGLIGVLSSTKGVPLVGRDSGSGQRGSLSRLVRRLSLLSCFLHQSSPLAFASTSRL